MSSPLERDEFASAGAGSDCCADEDGHEWIRQLGLYVCVCKRGLILMVRDWVSWAGKDLM